MDTGNRKSWAKIALRELLPVLCFFIPFVIGAVVLGLCFMYAMSRI